MEGPFGGRGEEFRCCSPSMSIRSIEIHYTDGRKPLIWALKVEQEYNGYKATTIFGGGVDMSQVNGNIEKVCL